MTEKRFTLHNRGLQGQFIKDTGKIMMIDDVVELLNMLHEEVGDTNLANEILQERVEHYRKENEQLKKNKFICLDCEHSGYVEIGCLCEYNDHWQDYITECEDFKELRE